MAHDLNKKWRSDDVKLREQADFSAMLLSERVLRGLDKSGFKIPSPIQLEAIPIGRFGKDLLVQAKSGTGKTLVFTVIALEMIRPKYFHPQVLIVAPTREIATQICSVITCVGKAFPKLTCCSFIGGLPLQEDKDRASVCQVVVGTPGRIKQLISLGSLPTKSIRLLVFDEADTLFQGPFKLDVDDIFKCLPENKQVIATSATFPVALKKIIFHYLRDPFVACLNSNDLALLGIVHYTKIVDSNLMPIIEYNNKLRVLEKILKTLKFSQCLIFCNLIGRVEVLCRDIKKWGFSTSFMSSAKEQTERLKVLDRLKHFKCKVLVSTDVTSRGIDVENVDLVINFDLALNTETYLHRVGRAGRYGSIGLAVSIITEKQLLYLKRIEDEGNFKSYKFPDPVPKDLLKNPVYGEYTLQEEKTKPSKIGDEDVIDSSETESSKVASNGIPAANSTDPSAGTKSLDYSFGIQSSTNHENNYNVRNSTPDFNIFTQDFPAIKVELNAKEEVFKIGPKNISLHVPKLPCNDKTDASDADKGTNQHHAQESVSEEKPNCPEKNLISVHSHEFQRISENIENFHQAATAPSTDIFSSHKDSDGFEASMVLNKSLSSIESIPKMCTEAASINCVLPGGYHRDETVESEKMMKNEMENLISKGIDCSKNSLCSRLKSDIKRFVLDYELSSPKAFNVSLATPENSDKPVDSKKFDITVEMIKKMEAQKRDFLYQVFTKFQESGDNSEVPNATISGHHYDKNEKRLDLDTLTSKNGGQNIFNKDQADSLDSIGKSNDPRASDSLKANQPITEEEKAEDVCVGDAASSKVVNVDFVESPKLQGTSSEQEYEIVSSSAESDCASLSSFLDEVASSDLSSNNDDTECDASSRSSSKSSESESMSCSDVSASSQKDQFIEQRKDISKHKNNKAYLKHSQSNSPRKGNENIHCKYYGSYNYVPNQINLWKKCAKKHRIPSNSRACLHSCNCRQNPNLQPLAHQSDKLKCHQPRAVSYGSYCNHASFCCNSHQQMSLPKSCCFLNAMPCNYDPYQLCPTVQPSYSLMYSIFQQQEQYIQGCVKKLCSSTRK